MDSWRAGCGGSRTSGSEERAGETDRLRSWHGAPVRSLLKNPQNLTENERASLARVAAVNKSLYREYFAQRGVSPDLPTAR